VRRNAGTTSQQLIPAMTLTKTAGLNAVFPPYDSFAALGALLPGKLLQRFCLRLRLLRVERILKPLWLNWQAAV